MKTKYFWIILYIIFFCNSNLLKANVFEGAKWIGVPPTKLPFNSDYLYVFDLEFDLIISKADTVSVLYGMNDPRLLNQNENIYNLSNTQDNTYIKFTFNGTDNIEIYRTGYHPNDSKEVPFIKFNSSNLKEGLNKVNIRSNSGITDIYLNDNKEGEVILNPYGKGGDYFAYPVLGEMAVEINKDGKSKIGNIKLKNFREPRNVIYSIEELFDSSQKINLPVRSMPELKTLIDIRDKEDVIKAEMISTARGIYDIYVNGKLVTGDYFYPGSTQYNKTHLYQTFNILPFLESGENEIRVLLGEGWWSGSSTFMTENWNFFGDRQSFISKINIEYKDKREESYFTSPEKWEFSVDGGLLLGSFFNGEIYDNSRNLKNRIWEPVVEIDLDSTVNKSIGDWGNIKLLSSFGDRITANDTLIAKQILEPRKNVYIYDMGQNFAGVPYIEFSNLKSGQSVNFRYAEVLYPPMEIYEPNVGMIMTENLRAAINKDTYIASGEIGEVFSPRFTLHGYRYIEITGLEEPLPLNQVKGLPLSSIQKINANFECSDSLVNRLWENIIWSAKSNFISIPTDCPQRNERLGWMGDISVFSPTATKMADISPLLRQYLTSIRDCQLDNGKYADVVPTGTGFGGMLWESAGIIVAWENFLAYNDLTTLEQHYPSMKKYIEYLFNETIDPESEVIVQNRDWGDLGDWLSPEYDKNDKSLLWECYLIYDLEIMEKVAGVLNKAEDIPYYKKLRNQRREFFINNYIDKETGKTIWSNFDSNKKGMEVDTQVSYALPIAMGIYNEPKFINNFYETINRENIADDGSLCLSNSLMTGFIGTAWISEALSKTNNAELAYKLLTNKEYPSWLYPVTQGATTIWERLNSYTDKSGFGNNNSMNSFNHYSFGSVGNWLITRSLGINISEKGDIIISPQPDPTNNITWAKGWRDTTKGRIESSWKVNNDSSIIEVILPEGQNGILIFRDQNIDLEPGLNRFNFNI